MASNYNHYLPKKIDLTPKKHHGMVVLIFILGFLFPPLAVAVRFGIGTDFFINLFLCICGYFPCHFHNFYVQNVRNNSNNRRTPKWAVRYGLVDPTEGNRKKAKSAWAGRYDERNPNSTLEAQEYEEGQTADDISNALANPTDTSGAGKPGAAGAGGRGRDQSLWNDNEIEFYENGQGEVPDAQAPNKNKWHYPANFEGAGAGPSVRDENRRGDYNDSAPPSSKPKKSSRFGKKKSHAPPPPSDADVPEWGRDYGAPRRTRTSTSASTRSQGSSGGNGYSNNTNNSNNVPEDAWGAGGGASSRQGANANAAATKKPQGEFDHQF
ncbi:hypothetical protein BDY24DRAFT_388284 [Mrakia frigida]|uniref:YqaE/Pmp3 family membrane protein n=1 Tax=Mrakia frigida TaxID=29902 RepID=UPI003FCC2320